MCRAAALVEVVSAWWPARSRVLSETTVDLQRQQGWLHNGRNSYKTAELLRRKMGRSASKGSRVADASFDRTGNGLSGHPQRRFDLSLGHLATTDPS